MSAGGTRPHALVLGAFALPGIAVLLFALVFPAGTWWRQREAIDRESRRLVLLREQNRALKEELRRLQRPEEIERIAREQYRMVRPGEEAWVPVPVGPPLGPEPSRRDARRDERGEPEPTSPAPPTP